MSDALEQVHLSLLDSPCYYGHGTDNPWDEAVVLVLDTFELSPDSAPGILQAKLCEWPERHVFELIQRLEQRIDQRIPLPYITGKSYFCGLSFKADHRALVPRSPIAELINQEFKPWLAAEPSRILDLCCGGGCIGLASAVTFQHAHVDLIDLDPEALQQARDNVSLHDLSSRVTVIQSDLFAACNSPYDLILCNPPYVDSEDLDSMPQEYRHEPAVALGAGDDGLGLIHRVLAGAADFLSPGGLLIAEVGNSWVALEEHYPDVPFLWLEFEHGGHGVFAMSREELLSKRESFG